MSVYNTRVTILYPPCFAQIASAACNVVTRLCQLVWIAMSLRVTVSAQVAALWVSPTAEHLVVAWKGHITIWCNADYTQESKPLASYCSNSCWTKMIEWERPDVDSRFRGQHFLSGAESDYPWGDDLR